MIVHAGEAGPERPARLSDLVGIPVERACRQQEHPFAPSRSASATIVAAAGCPKITRFICVNTIVPDCMVCLVLWVACGNILVE
jgi:hypothetical protein